MPMAMPIMQVWANDQDVAYLQANTVAMHLIQSESAQRLLSFGICKILEALITDSRSPYYGHGHAHVAQMGK